MHIGKKIKELSTKNNLSVINLAKRLGKTSQAVYEMYDREDASTKVLRQLSEMFDVPITYFFTEDEEEVKNMNVNGNNNTAIAGRNITANMGNSQEEKIGFLEKLLAEKDAMIAEKERMIQMLLERK